MHPPELSISSLRDSIQEKNQSTQAIKENHKELQQIFIENLQTIDRISFDQDFWESFSKAPKHESSVGGLLPKAQNILASIEEEDEGLVNSVSKQMTARTAEMAAHFLPKLALPLDEFIEKEVVKEEENSRFSNRVSFRSSRFNRMSFDFTQDKTLNPANKSGNLERLSRLSVMAKEMENSLFFNFEKREHNSQKDIDFIEKNILSMNFLDMKAIAPFSSMSFSKILDPVHKLDSLSPIDVLTSIYSVGLAILNYCEDEDVFLEKLAGEVEFVKGKLLGFLELIKISEEFLQENIDKQTNCQQVLLKTSLWVINLRKMASNIINMSSLVLRVLKVQESRLNQFAECRSMNTFFAVFEDYKNLREVYRDQALETFRSFFGVEYQGRGKLDQLKTTMAKRLTKDPQLYNWRGKVKDFQYFLLPLEELLRLRALIIPLFFEELDNIVTLIWAYINKYKNSFNVYQDFTMLIDQLFTFRRNKIKPLITQINNFKENSRTTFKNYSHLKSKELLERDLLGIESAFKDVRNEAKTLLLRRVQKSRFSSFPLLEYELIAKDLSRIQGLLMYCSGVSPLLDDLQGRIQSYNNLIKLSDNIKAVQSDPASCLKAIEKYIILSQELRVLLSWLKTREAHLWIKDLSSRVQKSIELVGMNLEIIAKVYRDLRLNEALEKRIYVEEHSVDLKIAEFHRIKKSGSDEGTPLGLLSEILGSLEKSLAEFESIRSLDGLETELKDRAQKIMEHIEKNKTELRKFIAQKKKSKTSKNPKKNQIYSLFIRSTIL